MKTHGKFGFAAFGGAILAAAAGCRTVGPDFEAPAVQTPTAYVQPVSPAAPTPVPEAWWTLYQDSTVDRLVAEALTQNPTVIGAIARWDEARARLRAAAAETRPLGGVPAFAQLAGESAERGFPGPGGTTLPYRTSGDSYRVPLEVSYEFDLWGRLRRQVESSEANAAALGEDLALLQLTLAADVVTAYITFTAAAHDRALLARTLELRDDELKLQQQRVQAGLSNELNLARARAEASTTRAELAAATQRQEHARHALALLTGRTPASFVFAPAEGTHLALPTIPAGLPSELLLRRPDVRGALARLHARVAEIGVAQTGFFPSLRLTASAGFESQELGELLSRPAQFWGISPALHLPFLNGGRTLAAVNVAEARAAQAWAEYQQYALTAFREVEDSLIALHQIGRQAEEQSTAAAATQEVATLARARYEQGFASYLEVIEAERTALTAQRSHLRLQHDQRAETARLVKALGGGWSLAVAAP